MYLLKYSQRFSKAGGAGKGNIDALIETRRRNN